MMQLRIDDQHGKETDRENNLLNFEDIEEINWEQMGKNVR
jgi:hypothetical protein